MCLLPGISYSVSTQEYLVQRCLADDQQLLDNISPEALLNSDLLTLDEGSLKTELPDMIIESALVSKQRNEKLNQQNDIKSESELTASSKTDEPRRSLRHTENKLDSEEQLCK